MEIANDQLIEMVCRWLQHAQGDVGSEVLIDAIRKASAHELESLLGVLVARFDQLGGSPQRLRILMQQMASCQLAVHDHDSDLLAADVLAAAYDRLSEVDAQAAAHSLQILAAQGVAGRGDEESLDSLAGVLLDNPPKQWQHAALAISPLWNANIEQLEFFFDRLQDGGMHLSTTAVLLDLANFAVRRKQLAHHPWQAKQQDLIALLNGLVARLEKLQRDPNLFGTNVDEIQSVLADSVALSVAVCDALGWIADSRSSDVLIAAMQLSHRRIQTEAAAALARIGDASGRQRLIDLAQDCVARRRAVAYAEELGFVEEIDENLRTPVALAESELAAWLADPSQFGLPPHSLELIDSRTMFWPSYDTPQDCFLFRFTYHFPAGVVSNIGLAGPASHAFMSDLANLPLDDIYAAFAGWQVEHEEIFEVPAALFTPAQRREADRLLSDFEERGFNIVECMGLTFLLGETAVLAKLSQDSRQLWGISDGTEALHFPLNASPTAMSAEVILAIFRGRKLLRTFNA